MSAINRALLVGRLTRDVELRHTPGGTAVADFSVAINSKEKRDDEWVDRVDYIDVRVWAAQAESCAKYIGKGSLVGIDGRLRQDRWETDSGGKRSKVLVVASSVQFLNRRDEDGGSEARVPAAAEADFGGGGGGADFGGGADDDIPF